MATTLKEVAMQKQRREVSVRNEPYIYKIEIFENGRWRRKCFRVQKKIRGVDGKRKTVSSTFDSLSEARSFRDSLKNVTKDYLSQFQYQNRSFKFSEVFKRFLNHKRFEAGLQPTTIQKYEQTGRHFQFFHSFDFNQITPQVIDTWVNLLHDPQYLETQRNNRINYRHEFDLFRGVINYFVEFENEEYRNPIRTRHNKRLCKRPRNSEKEIRFLNQDQQQQLIESLNSLIDSGVDFELARLMFVQLETGLRIGEVSALQKEQINFSTGEIYIDRHLQWDRAKGGKITLAKGTKGGRNRMIYMSGECRRILKLKNQFDPKAKTFSIGDDWVSYRKIQHFYKKQLKAIDSLSLGSHTLRHTFAVNFLRETKNIHALQKLLGHADLVETQRYAKYSDESTKEAFALFDGTVLDVDFQRPDSQPGSHG